MRGHPAVGLLRPASVVLLLTVAALQTCRLLNVRAAVRSESAGQAKSIPPGEPLPAVELLRLGGGKTRLSELFGDRCGVVVFYATECPYCRELATGHAFRASLMGLPVVWVSVPDHTADVFDFVRDHRLPGPTFILGSWEDTNALGVGATPRVVAVGPSARLLSVISRDAPDIPESCVPRGQR